MRVVIGAAAMALLLGGAAMAQAQTAPAAAVPAANCPAVPAEPTLPDGATVNAQVLNQGDAAYQAWGHAAQAALVCIRADKEQHDAIVAARIAEYNALNTRLRAVTDSWAAERAEYCARPRMRCAAQN